VVEQVYLPMSYVYGVRGTGKLTPLVLSLRKELHSTSYDRVDWNAARNQCAPTDLYYPHPKIQDILWWALYKAEGLLLGSGLRMKALAEVMRHVHYEVSPCSSTVILPTFSLFYPVAIHFSLGSLCPHVSWQSMPFLACICQPLL